jgi:predicted alpha/beta-fold hydrolase
MLLNRLTGSVVGRHVYSQSMGGNLLNLLKHHAKSLTESKNEAVCQAVARGLALKRPTMAAFDDAFTRVAGGSSPPFPFASAHDYYVWSSSHKMLPDIKVPFLAINAADDPIVQEVPKGTGDDSWATMVLTTTGGHLGWFEASSSGQIQRWVKKPVLEWLRVVGEHIVHDLNKGRPLVERDGFLTEEGRDNLGCKEINGVDFVVAGEGEGSGLKQGL